MNRRSFLWLLGGAALSGSLTRLDARIVQARAATNLAALGLPEVTIAVSDAGYAVSPQQTPAGWTLVTLENQLEATDTSADIMLIPDGESLEALLTAVAGPDAGPPPDWVFQAPLAGAPWVTAGQSGQALVHLTAGNWAVFSPTPLAPATMTVLEADDDADDRPTVTVDAELTLQDFAFLGLDGPLAAGPQLWKVVNAGPQPHLMALSPLPDGTTQGAFMDEVMAMMSAPPSADAAIPPGPPIIGGCSTLSTDQTIYLALDLGPGTYGAICFFPDGQTGAPHAAMGMVQVFTVG